MTDIIIIRTSGRISLIRLGVGSCSSILSMNHSVNFSLFPKKGFTQTNNPAIYYLSMPDSIGEQEFLESKKTSSLLLFTNKVSSAEFSSHFPVNYRAA